MGKLFIIEGLWRTKKTTLCLYLKKKYGFAYIPEPNHVKAGVKGSGKELNYWYRKRHLENFKAGAKKAIKGLNVVVERGPLSALVFEEVYSKNSQTKRFWRNVKNLFLENKSLIPYLIYIRPQNIKTISSLMNKKQHIWKYSNPGLLEIFDKRLQYYINQLRTNNLIHLAQFKSNKDLVGNFEKYLDQIL